MKKCAYCGAENPDGKRWCQRCLKLLQAKPASTYPHYEHAAEDARSRLRGSMGANTYGNVGNTPEAVSPPSNSFPRSDSGTVPPNSAGTRLHGDMAGRKREEPSLSVPLTPENPVPPVVPAVTSAMQKCKHCGHEYDWTLRYCTSCGRSNDSPAIPADVSHKTSHENKPAPTMHVSHAPVCEIKPVPPVYNAYPQPESIFQGD